MKKFSVKTIVAIGIGAALFFVLGRFVAIPSPVPNTSITTQYGLLIGAAAKVLKPEMILLDEPTAGQDLKYYTEIMDFLSQLN